MTSDMSTASAGKSEPAWPSFKPAKPDPVLGKKEMSPEQTLIEFISTSAGLHGVKKQSLRNLEWDLLKVFPYNIMPANAAAWYMAKRKYYSDQPPDNQLLPFLLNKYPDKFRLSKFQVEFLETYSKETARRKLNYLVQFGLDAYFSHKVDEYTVYFFDPNYYERTEPFHESLQLCVKGARSKLVAAYFSQNKKQYSYQQHSSTLASVSKLPAPKVMTNTTGVIVSMVNNQYGFLKFGSGEKALFCAKGLFRDGWQYTGDPLRLPAMYFDAYQVAGGIKSGNETCKWLAVLVWCGLKPAAKYYCSNSDFISTPVGFLKPSLQNVEGRRLRQPSSSMMIGQVVGIRKNGAIISVRDDSQDQVFVPGWSKENSSRPGLWLTTLTGDTIGLRDLVAYYIDSDETMPGYTAVGKNVMVLKEHEEVVSTKTRRNRMSVSMSAGANYDPRASESSNHGSEDSDESISDSEAEPVSDSELEWLENDITEIIERDGPKAKTHSLFLKLKKTLAEVRSSSTIKSKKPGRDGRDSGIESNTTTPRGKNTPLKVGKTTADGKIFWRTKAAFASIDTDYRSSDDDDYESGDEVPTFDVPAPRRRTVSVVSSASGQSRSRRQRRSSNVPEPEKKPELPYWIRAISMPEEYDETTGNFVPVDKWYNEEKDPDYFVPDTDDEEEHEEVDTEDVKGDGGTSTEGKTSAENAEGKKEDQMEKEKAEKEQAEKEKAELEQKEADEKENLDEELKLLKEEAEKELPEELLEGKHRQSVAKLPSPEKIIVTRPEEEGEGTKEVVTIQEPKQRRIWYPPNYIRFIDNIMDDLDSDVESVVDPEYVPPAIILNQELDYDEYDPEEMIDEAEITGLVEDLKVELHKAASHIPIWVPVESVRERREHAEQERLRREEALKAAQEEAALKAARQAEAEKEAEKKGEGEEEGLKGATAIESGLTPAMRKLNLQGLKGTVQDMNADPKPQRNNANGGKVTRAKVEGGP